MCEGRKNKDIENTLEDNAVEEENNKRNSETSAVTTASQQVNYS